MRYVVSHGRRIAVETLDLGTTPKKKKRHKPFRAEWVKLPLDWAEALRRSKSANTYHLALAILFEAFRRKHVGGEIVLSTVLTRMQRCTKMRAARELARLGLIQIEQNGQKAFRVSIIIKREE
jgi:hypothetical protein